MARPVRAGLSLLELLAVVVILGVIAAIVIGRITLTTAAAKEHACFQNKTELNGALEKYYFDNGVWTTDIADIAVIPYFPESLPVCPVTGDPYAIDPVTKRIAGHTTGSH